MGKQEHNYLLANEVELDEGFSEIVPNRERRDDIALELRNNDGKYKSVKGLQQANRTNN